MKIIKALVSVLLLVSLASCAISDGGIILESRAEAEVQTTVDSYGVAHTYEENYRSPIDFSDLKRKNSDIYAYLLIKDAKVSFPVLQHSSDNSFYLDHNVDKREDKLGAIFTEDYTSKDFTDPVSVIYGHTSIRGRMLGPIQKNFTNKKFFDSHEDITVYLPDRELHYKIFAAVPYGNMHILANYDFGYEMIFNYFFDDILSTRSLEANFNHEYDPMFGDRVLVISTCLNGSSNTQRYLLMARLVSETGKIKSE